MVGNPNLTYKIYLSPKNKPDQKIYVATINYFGVLDHSHGGHASNGAMGLIYAELSGDFPLGDSRQPTYKSLRPFDLVS